MQRARAAVQHGHKRPRAHSAQHMASRHSPQVAHFLAPSHNPRIAQVRVVQPNTPATYVAPRPKGSPIWATPDATIVSTENDSVFEGKSASAIAEYNNSNTIKITDTKADDISNKTGGEANNNSRPWQRSEKKCSEPVQCCQRVHACARLASYGCTTC